VAEDPASKSWLLAVARRAAPHPWGDRFRDAAARQDRQALPALAAEALRDGAAGLGEFSPQALAALGRLLRDSGQAGPLRRAAQRGYPDDFWVNLDLANALCDAKRPEEAVGYNRVAVGLRPEAVAGHNNLGIALQQAKDLEGAIAEFRTVNELDPGLPFAH